MIPDNVEKIIMTKKDYYRNVEQLLIDKCKAELEIERLNNIIDELEWKPISEYEKPKYDWVLVKYYIEPNFECIPTVAEKKVDKWYDRNDNEIIGEIRYFMDMQQIDKLQELKEKD